jgi:hypothetical protein
MATKTLKELSKETINYLRLNEGTSEFDMSINDISRNVIAAMKAEFGNCFVGKINLYGEERKKGYKLVEYTGQIIYNFEYSFCLPCYDAELERMIDERDKAEYTCTADDYIRVNAITERIYALKGENLFWS